MESSVSTQVWHLSWQERVFRLRSHRSHVASRRAAGILFGMAMRSDVVATRLGSVAATTVLAADRDALARILRMSLAANSYAVVVHAIRHKRLLVMVSRVGRTPCRDDSLCDATSARDRRCAR